MRALIAALSKGEAVGLGSDVRLDSGELIPFFGQPMPTNIVPARLAQVRETDGNNEKGLEAFPERDDERLHHGDGP